MSKTEQPRKGRTGQGLAHQHRTIAIASDFRVDGAKSPEIPQKEGVLGSEIAARNRKSTFYRTLKSQCSIAFSCLGNRAIFGVRDGHRNRKNRKNRCDFGALRGRVPVLPFLVFFGIPSFFSIFFEKFLVFLSVFPSFSRDFRGLVGKKSLFFWWFFLAFFNKKKRGKEGQGWSRSRDSEGFFLHLHHMRFAPPT